MQVTQLYTNKAHMIAMGTQLQEQMAMVRVAGTLSKSNEVMKLVNDMMRVRPPTCPRVYTCPRG